MALESVAAADRGRSGYGAAVALNRFGLGARPQDRLEGPAQAWVLEGQAAYRASPPAAANLQPSEPLLAEFLEAQRAFRELRRASATGDVGPNPAAALALEAYATQLRVRTSLAVGSSASFVERLVHFWANHFAVSADRSILRALAGALEIEAIRPNVLGRFSDLLLAVERHPAMLIYLDQARSIGPNSQMVRQSENPRRLGLNENLARELLELHTLGGGHTQDDVVELALALTGWTVGGTRLFRDAPPGRFVFRAEAHEPGARRCLGRRYAEAGEGQALAILHDLSLHPATARNVSLKLARHFIADEPPAAVVQRLAAVFLRTGGDLPAVYRTLIESPEAWAEPLAKFKSPWEWMVSALRALQLPPHSFPFRSGLSALGQPTWRSKSPAGWPDRAEAWAAPYGLFVRVRLAEKLAEVARDQDARLLARQVLPGVLQRRTATMIAEADSATQALALLLCAPEFLRR